LRFVSLSWGRITDKLAINWQNFARVRLRFKFAFIVLIYTSTKKLSFCFAKAIKQRRRCWGKWGLNFWSPVLQQYLLTYLSIGTSTRRQRGDLCGLRFKLPPVTLSQITQT